MWYFIRLYYEIRKSLQCSSAKFWKSINGGVDANALQRPKRFFGAARNIEEGGSLTIISTALIETGSEWTRLFLKNLKEQVIQKLIMDRKVADKRIYPALI